MEIVDSFKQLIKSKLSKKLQNRFKNLTHITPEEIEKSGVPFEKAFDEFAAWSNGNDTVYLSWPKSDLYTLVSNYRQFKNTNYVKILNKYADAQAYCMSFIESENNNQISLANCAEIFNIDINGTQFHRALADCYITAFCFKEVYDKDKFAKYINVCTPAFFEKLVFKPYFINKKKQGTFDVDKVELICPLCSKTINAVSEYIFDNNTFKTVGICSHCLKKFLVNVQAKQNYDNIRITQRLIKMSRKNASHINGKS
ncbi:MAG: exonuclease domain-containing protein [Clostridiales bacterium]|nr:exonuclease domain-containing protein [Clostridiales bacterium]